VLDHTALLVLELWAARGSAPDPTALLREARFRMREGTLSLAAVARLAAEVPEYWLGMLAPSEADITVLHMPGDAATGVLFTSEAGAREFFSANPPSAGATAEAAATRTPITLVARPHQWSTSAFLVIAEEFDAVVVDPNPDGSGGLRLTGPAVQLVLDALSERLMPRVPGFAWEDCAPGPAMA
jgi:hypothetical protein